MSATSSADEHKQDTFDVGNSLSTPENKTQKNQRHKARTKKRKQPPTPEPAYEPSDYEKQRLENIKKNEARLKELGLGNKGSRVSNVDRFKGHKKEGNRWLIRVSWEGCASSEDTWEPMSNLKKDVPVLLKEYMDSHESDFRNNPRKRSDVPKNAKKLRSSPTEDLNNQVEMNAASQAADPPRPCFHDTFLVGIGYNTETNSAYCGGNFDLSKAFCATCGAKASDTGMHGAGNFVKPSENKPIYICINRHHQHCIHMQCFDCFWKNAEMSASTRLRRVS